MTAFGTFNPCETASKIAAIQITMDDIYYIRSPEPKTWGISIIPDLFERFEVGFNALVVGAGAVCAGAIDVSWAAGMGCWQSHNMSWQAFGAFNSKAEHIVKTNVM
jgi:hypothetical protein